MTCWAAGLAVYEECPAAPVFACQRLLLAVRMGYAADPMGNMPVPLNTLLIVWVEIVVSFRHLAGTTPHGQELRQAEPFNRFLQIGIG